VGLGDPGVEALAQRTLDEVEDEVRYEIRRPRLAGSIGTRRARLGHRPITVVP
jgi:hypothetical protein